MPAVAPEILALTEHQATSEAGTVSRDSSTSTSTRRFIDRDMQSGELHRVAGGTAVIYSVRCPGKDGANEDAAALVAVDADKGVLSVADGVGGLPAGDHASGLAIAELCRSLRDAAAGRSELREAILNGFESANHAVLATGSGGATTLAAVEIQGHAVRPYHVGDSMILVTGQRGKIKLETICHSPVGYAIEAGLLDPIEAMHHDERHVVSNMIGSANMHIAVGPTLEMSRYDTLVMATDGLFDNLHEAEIVELVRKGPLADVARALVERSLERMQRSEPGVPSKPDDLTLIVYRRDSSNG